jgi:hypothetical protein
MRLCIADCPERCIPDEDEQNFPCAKTLFWRNVRRYAEHFVCLPAESRLLCCKPVRSCSTLLQLAYAIGPFHTSVGLRTTLPIFCSRCTRLIRSIRGITYHGTYCGCVVRSWHVITGAGVRARFVRACEESASARLLVRKTLLQLRSCHPGCTTMHYDRWEAAGPSICCAMVRAIRYVCDQPYITNVAGSAPDGRITSSHIRPQAR